MTKESSSMVASRNIVIWILAVLLPSSIHARPVVRNIRSAHEFDKLLEKHATETGLPVVVDYYSDSCGPCRMMAPIFKKVAHDYIDKAVFVKVDTNAQSELSSRYQIRSLPTFQYFVYGQKYDQAVGGIGEGPLRQQTDKAIRSAELDNVVLTLDELMNYYTIHDDAKSTKEIQIVYKKCSDMVRNKKLNPQQLCLGDGANKLSRRLKKKYGGSPPKLIPRFTAEQRQKQQEQDKTDDDTKTKGDTNTNRKDSSSTNTKKDNNNTSTNTNKPNLHLASIDELKMELEKRYDDEREQQVENEDPDEDETDGIKKYYWTRSEYPEKVIIVGGGPAGLAAAIYAARAGLNPVVIAPSMGGQLQGKGVDVENYPGLHNTTGPEVVALMKKQAIYYGTVFEDDIVTKVIVSNDKDNYRPIQIVTNGTGIIDTHTLIVATGADSNWLGIKGEYELRGGGVSSCATCDGFLYTNKDVLVVGGGDTAMEDALVLARTSRKVTIVHRRDKFRASKVLVDRVLNYHDPTKFHVLWNTVVKEINGKQIIETDNTSSSNDGDDGDNNDEVVDMDNLQMIVTGAVLENVVSGEIYTQPCDAVFVAIGHTPNTQFLKEVVEFQSYHAGYVQTISGTTKTSVPGIFAAGDVADPIYRQAVTSSGSGAAAALDAERYLTEYNLGNEQAEFEAELLAEFMMGSTGSNDSAGDTNVQYNVYDDVESNKRTKGMKESTGPLDPVTTTTSSSASSSSHTTEL